MRVSDEPNVEILRQKARVLESEKERLTAKLSEVLHELLVLKKGQMIEVNLPGLVAPH
jgi:hypothetical protein